VVVTGAGVISPAGASVSEVLAAYRSGATGFGRVATVDFDPSPYLSVKQLRRMDRLGVFAVATSAMALADAGLDLAAHDPHRIGVVLGTGLGPVESIERFTVPVLESGAAAANPAVFPNTVYNAAAGQVSMQLGVKGPTSTLTSAHAAGASALCVAHDLLRTGAADAVLCPAVDAFSPAALRAYERIPLFSGPGSGRYTLAEGGVTLLLERESFARARGATVLGVLSGHGIAADAVGIGRWDPHGAGVERAMRAALAESGVDTVSAVWANASGLASVDRPEAAAIDRVLPGVPVEAPKRVLGEPVGAGAQLAIALASRCAGPVLVNSSSLGGTHVSLVVTKE
jgi:3-oxoacyl-[acyl-carrier-protein] synthase II